MLLNKETNQLSLTLEKNNSILAGLRTLHIYIYLFFKQKTKDRLIHDYKFISILYFQFLVWTKNMKKKLIQDFFRLNGWLYIYIYIYIYIYRHSNFKICNISTILSLYSYTVSRSKLPLFVTVATLFSINECVYIYIYIYTYTHTHCQKVKLQHPEYMVQLTKDIQVILLD